MTSIKNSGENNKNYQPLQLQQMFIEQPTEHDILCGKDKSFSKHKGNQMFRDTIMSMTNEYRNALGKPERMKLTKKVVDTFKEHNHARFLRLVELSGDQQVWEEINGKYCINIEQASVYQSSDFLISIITYFSPTLSNIFRSTSERQNVTCITIRINERSKSTNEK
jgi:hypothetical protein